MCARKVLITLVVAMLASAGSAPLSAASPKAGASAGAAQIPARTLQCTVGRALNLDPARPQTAAEIVREGAYRFTIELPAAPAPVGPPPDPADPAGPVDPAVALRHDQAGLFRDMQQPFDRVIDRWPDRVELVSRLGDGPWHRFFAITDIAPAAGTASLFSSRVQDAASLDLGSVYLGSCLVSLHTSHR